eukprot:385009-Rhodomonas_salina.2
MADEGERGNNSRQRLLQTEAMGFARVEAPLLLGPAPPDSPVSGRLEQSNRRGLDSIPAADHPHELSGGDRGFKVERKGRMHPSNSDNLHMLFCVGLLEKVWPQKRLWLLLGLSVCSWMRKELQSCLERSPPKRGHRSFGSPHYEPGEIFSR